MHSNGRVLSDILDSSDFSVRELCKCMQTKLCLPYFELFFRCYISHKPAA